MRRSSLAGLHGVFFVLIVAFLAIAPVPLGSNRPFFWEANAAVIAVIAFLYLGALANRPDRLRLPLAAFKWPALLAGVSAVWLLIQLLPLPFEPLSPPVWTQAGQAMEMSLSRYITLDRAATSLMLLSYIAYGLLFFVCAQITVNDSRAHRFLQALFAVIILHAGIGIFLLFQLGDTLLFLPKWAYEGVATGFFVNRNSFATFLAFGLGIGSALLVNAVTPRQRGGQNRPFREVFRLDNALISIGGYGAGLAVVGSALLLTSSRMGAFVGLIGLGMPIIIGVARSGWRRSTTFVAVLAVALLVSFVLLLSGGGLAERFGSNDVTQSLRWPLFKQTLHMIGQRPVTGFGGGTFEDAFAIYHRLPLSADVVWDRAHNLYLELFADLGIFALGVMAAFVYVIWRIARAIPQRSETLAPVASLTVAAVALTHSLLDFSLQIQAIEFMFIAVLAAGYGQAVGGFNSSRQQDPQVERPRPARVGEVGPFAAAEPPELATVTSPAHRASRAAHASDVMP